MNHGTVASRRLVGPQARLQRIARADWFHASVSSGRALKKMRLEFIGFVQIASEQYLIEHLSTELQYKVR